MAITTGSTQHFPQRPQKSKRVWKIKVRDRDEANRQDKWLYVALVVTFTLTCLGWLAWLSIAGPDNVLVHDIWMP